jgi:hypothetical protein
MSKGMKYLLLAMLLLSFAAVVPRLAAANTETNNNVTVIMSNAYYADLDGGGAKDDIVAIYDIIPPNSSGSNTTYFIELHCKLILPSGFAYIYDCAVVTSTGCIVTQEWFNVATEAGWYTLSVYAYSASSQFNSGYGQIVFDPPGGDPGPPSVQTMIVELPEA